MLISQLNLLLPFKLAVPLDPARRRFSIRQRACRSLTLLLIGASLAAGTPAPTLLLDGVLAGATIIAVGERGTIVRTTDDGRSRTLSGQTTLATLTGVTFCGNSAGWAVGHDAIVLHSTDGGGTWVKQWQGELTDSFLDVFAVDANHVLAVGAYGLFMTTGDGGMHWTRQHIIPDDFHLNRISRGPTGTLYIAGEHGTLLRSIDHGVSWRALQTDYQGSFYGVLPLDEHTLLAHGLRGRVYRSDNDGASWSRIETKRTELIATAAISNAIVVLAGNMRTVLVSKDHAQSFESMDVGLPGNVAELVPLPDGGMIALGEFGAKRIEVTRTP
jgi:photosystem II stability/assembly factor-like uncharacterized protein